MDSNKEKLLYYVYINNYRQEMITAKLQDITLTTSTDSNQVPNNSKSHSIKHTTEKDKSCLEQLMPYLK